MKWSRIFSFWISVFFLIIFILVSKLNKKVKCIVEQIGKNTYSLNILPKPDLICLWKVFFLWKLILIALICFYCWWVKASTNMIELLIYYIFLKHLTKCYLNLKKAYIKIVYVVLKNNLEKQTPHRKLSQYIAKIYNNIFRQTLFSIISI